MSYDVNMIDQLSNGQAEGRDAKTGRFVKGWKGGPGNPHARSVAEYRSIICDELTPKRMRVIARKLIADAFRGNAQAIKELFDRAMGKPQQRLDVDLQLSVRNFETMVPLELIAEAERLDKERVAAGLAPALIDELPPELKDIRQRQLGTQ